MASRIIAIDYGQARIGLACSDENKCIAFPMAVVKASKQSQETVRLVKEALDAHAKEKGYKIEKIIIGMPLLMSGKSGLMADEVNHFVKLLQEVMPESAIITWDERLTSVQAERTLREANMSRKKRVKHVDTISATLILQNYLDFTPSS